MQIQPIYADEVNETSRGVSQSEFIASAFEGIKWLNARHEVYIEPTGLIDNLGTVKSDTFKAMQTEDANVVLDVATGAVAEYEPSDGIWYVGNRPYGTETVSVPVGESYASYCKALHDALATFDLTSAGQHLRIWRNEDAGTVDISPVMLVESQETAENVGSATHAVEGAIAADGSGTVYPPHIVE